MNILKRDTFFGLLVLLLFCAATLALPACSNLPAGGNFSALAGMSDSRWGNPELQTELRAEQTIWTQEDTRLAASARLHGSLGDSSGVECLAGVRVEQEAIGADLLIGSENRLFGMDYTWQPITGFLLRMGLQHDGESVSAKTALELQLNRQWSLTGEYQSSESANLSLVGLRGRW